MIHQQQRQPHLLAWCPMALHCESLSVILPTPADYAPSTSPSVYIAYNGLEAYISCSSHNVARGKAYNKTIAYEPAYLSTSISARAEQTCAFTEIIYTELANYPYSDGSSLILSLPSDLSSIDPAWSTCVPNSYGAFDPPSTLQQATALTDVSPEPTSSVHATPGGHIGLAYSPATTKTSVSESPSGTPPTPSSGQSKKLKPIDPSDTSPAPENSKIDKDVTESVHDRGRGESPGTVSDVTKLPPSPKLPYLPLTSEQSTVQDPNKAESIVPTSHASISTAQIPGALLPIRPSNALLSSSAQAVHLASALETPLIVGQSITRAPDSKIIFANPSTAPENHATIADPTVYAGLSDAVRDGSTHVALTTTTRDLLRKPVTLTDGLVVSPYGSSIDFKMGTQIVSSKGPAITSSGALVSLGPSDLNTGLSFINATGSSGTIHQFGTSLGSGASNVSNAVAFTGRSARSRDHRSWIMLAFLAVAVVTMVS